MSKSPGARRRLSVAVALVLIFGHSQPVRADLAGDGQAAFDDRDYAQAEELWRKAAAQGSPRAMLGLGLLRDLGLGSARDPAAAFAYYREAAALGLADAQFNVGVMLDSGVGTQREPLQAAGWYGRAAAKGHARARYNLGLLFSQGDGVPRNTDLARYWLQSVSDELPAATDHLRNLALPSPDQRGFAAPVPLEAGIIRADAATGADARVELSWASGPSVFGMPFLVEIVTRPGPGKALRQTEATETHSSAISLPVDDTAGQIAWRVSRRDADAQRYAASPWQLVEQGEAPAPLGIIRIDVWEQDGAAAKFAEDLIRVFEAAGYWTQIQPTDARQGQSSSVSYAYEADLDLARDLAVSLPGIAVREPTLDPDAQASPGMAVLHLVGGRPTPVE